MGPIGRTALLIGTALIANSEPAPPAQLPQLTLVAEIGCESCGGPAQLGAILDVAVDDSGSVLVTNADAPMLRQFDRTGRVRWTAAADGMGPGELRRPLRGMLGPGVVQVVDMTQRRVTRFKADGSYQSSSRVVLFPAAVGAQARTGTFVVLTDDFRGGKALERWTPIDSGVSLGPVPPASEPPPGTITFASIAVGPDGGIALARDGNTYRIELLTREGKAAHIVSRDLPQMERTAAEQAALAQIQARPGARARAERGSSGAQPAVAPRPSGAPNLKPHIAIDGLRFDDAGRLWVRTARDDGTSTILDVFTSTGEFAGEVRLDSRITAFAWGGRWLALGAESAAGYPVVRLFQVR